MEEFKYRMPAGYTVDDAWKDLIFYCLSNGPEFSREAHKALDWIRVPMCLRDLGQIAEVINPYIDGYDFIDTESMEELLEELNDLVEKETEGFPFNETDSMLEALDAINII